MASALASGWTFDRTNHQMVEMGICSENGQWLTVISGTVY